MHQRAVDWNRLDDDWRKLDARRTALAAHPHKHDADTTQRAAQEA
jgi:hypothetical protein